MKSHRFWKRQAVAALGVLTMVLASIPLAQATDLPAGVLSYLRQKDPKVKVRFDGLVLFSNGQSYVPVIPQDPSLSPDSQQVIATLPEKEPYPDLIQFDNNFFLMRLVQTSSGRLTFPKMSEYPLQLKEGMLPQDFVMPKNLFIPVELKVILGALPYNPSYTPTNTPALSPVLAGFSPEQLRTANRQTYVFDLNQQKVLGIDPNTGAKTGEVALDCSPSGLQMSPDGKLLFVPCLTTNELAVVDTGSNLVKTRVPVGQRPDAVLFVNPTHDVVISNRYSSFLSVINSEELVSGQKIDLPGNGGAMAQIPGEKVPKLVVADAFKPQLYVVNLNTGTVEKTIPALPEVSALKVLQTDKGGIEIWAVSRTKDQVMVVDMFGKALKTLDVGNKPVDLAEYGDKVLVLSAGDSKVSVVDKGSKASVSTITLQQDGFPSGMVVVPADKVAYITMAGSKHLVILNPESGSVETTLPVDYRASMISMTPSQEEIAKFAAAVGTPSQDGTPSVNPNPAVDPQPGQSKKSAEASTKKPRTLKSSQSVAKQPAKKPDDAKVQTGSAVSVQKGGAAQAPSPATGNTGGKFRLDLHLGKENKGKPTEHTSSNQKSSPAKPAGLPTTEQALQNPGQAISAPQVVKTPQANQSKSSSKDESKKKQSAKSAKAEPDKQPAKPSAGDELVGKEASVMPVKPGVRLEQKPLAMPMDLPTETALPAAKPVDVPVSPPSSAPKANK